MRFFRNREIKRLCTALAAVSLLICVPCLIVQGWAGLFVVAACLLLSALFLIFTAWQYRELEQLSLYLRRISAGDYSLDVRDQSEGELSILKSEIYKMTVRLSESNEQLLKEKRRLADSMADISHQLKTPLTSMLVMADLLHENTLPEEQRQTFINHIHTQLERIQWLVSSLLMLSKLDAGVVEMKREAVLIQRLVEDAVQPLLIPMEIKNQTLKLDGNVNASFSGDLHWSTEALVNILKNCVEHTAEGGVLAVAWSENPLYSEIKISDNGEGIDKSDLPHIFTRFYRGKNAGEDSVGIGLAMAKSLLTQQGGDITAESEKGKGTTFTIRFYKGIV